MNTKEEKALYASWWLQENTQEWQAERDAAIDSDTRRRHQPSCIFLGQYGTVSTHHSSLRSPFTDPSLSPLRNNNINGKKSVQNLSLLLQSTILLWVNLLSHSSGVLQKLGLLYCTLFTLFNSPLTSYSFLFLSCAKSQRVHLRLLDSINTFELLYLGLRN